MKIILSELSNGRSYFFWTTFEKPALATTYMLVSRKYESRRFFTWSVALSTQHPSTMKVQNPVV